MPAMIVTRLDDPGSDLLADYRHVPDPALIARRGLFVAEGRLVVRRLLAESTLTPRSVMITETAYASLADAIGRHPDLPVYVVGQEVMNTIVGFNIHRGCLALGERPPARPWQELAREARRLVVLERVGDADNVGSVMRSAAAFAADAVLLGPSCADPLYRKAIRTSMGAALVLPFAAIQPWPAALGELRADGRVIIGLTPRSDAAPLRDVVESLGHRRAAILLGHEGEGLTAAALAACDQLARIPVTHAVDSLNVATAAAIALYELTR